LPPNAPVPRGKDVDIRLYVDLDHAGEKVTRRSRTGFLVYVNGALITWYPKRQPTVESSVFGAEFVALKNGMESVRGLRYKLRIAHDGCRDRRSAVRLTLTGTTCRLSTIRKGRTQP
jgi:hypothetical protein